MDPTRRAALALLLASTWPRPRNAAPAVVGTARIIVGAAPGGRADIIGPLLTEPLSGPYATQVIVLNRPSPSSRLAAEAVKAAARRDHPAARAAAGADALPAGPAAYNFCRARRTTTR